MIQKDNLCHRFLTQNGTREGSFRNFVNKSVGIIQEGYTVIEVAIGQNGEIHLRNIIMDKNRQKSAYEGSARMRLNGNRLHNLEIMTEDLNTKNQIKNHAFEGYVINDHIFILETYDEIFDGGKVEKRRNHLHYFFPSEKEIVMLGDIYVNNELLVFAGTTLTWRET
ncbi:MAG: hypothetical protein JW963_17960 [Anaerolineales bacterium]|nr:hypothetical protein [Anaerolineales bacterium]